MGGVNAITHGDRRCRMNNKGLLVAGGGLLAALWAMNNPASAQRTLDRVLEALVQYAQEEERRTLQAKSTHQALPLPQAVPPHLAPHALERLATPELRLNTNEILASLNVNPDRPAGSDTTYTPPVDEDLARLIDHPAVVLIVGHRGRGKTALAVRLQELLRDVAAPYAVGLPSKASKLLPSWYGITDDPGLIPRNAIVYIPESYRLFHSRSSQSAQGRAIADLVNLSRHRRHTLIFDVQNAAHLDRNIISEVDLVLVKQPGPLQQGFERSQLAPIMDAARTAFAGVPAAKRKSFVWVFAPDSGTDGKLMQNELADFWSEGISTMFSETAVSLGIPNTSPVARTSGNAGPTSRSAKPRPGKKTTTESKREKVMKMSAAGYSQRKIASTLGISPSYVNKLLKATRP